MRNFFKKITIILFLFCFNQMVMAKPIPPGSGEGDVPANILILLDNSKSMSNNKIGATYASVIGATIDGAGNKILASADTERGGLYKLDAAGDPINFEGVKRNGTPYSVETWYPSDARDKTCDYKLTKNSLTGSFTLPVHRRTAHVQYKTGVSMKDTNINENLIFFLMWANGSESYIVGLNETTLQCRIAILQADASPTRNFDFATKDGDLIMVALGTASGTKKSSFTSCNLSQSDCEEVIAIGKSTGTTKFGQKATKSWKIGLDSNASYVYVSDSKGIFGFELNDNTIPMISDMDTIAKNCPGAPSGIISKTQDHITFDVSSEGDDIFFAVSKKRRHLQRIIFRANGTCYVQNKSTIGVKKNQENIGSAGGLTSTKVNFTATPSAVSVIGNRVLITHGSYVDEFFGDRILGGARDTAWQNQIGGGRITRWEGAKKAISSVLSDSTLTSGANFGFGWWSAGEDNRTGWYCDKDGTNCTYWTGWNASKNEHNECSTNYNNVCLAVPIGTEGASEAIGLLNSIPTRAGTDSHAWSQMASGYFNANAPNGEIENFDIDTTCQLNYVIVISDGMMRNHGLTEIATKNGQQGSTKEKIVDLRESLGVKTLLVAYGDGIKDQGTLIFNYLSMYGSCNATTLTEAENRKDCESTIEARTPGQLKAKLASKIRQILAEKLAFTAPSITASIQEGGSLYQAQFEYEQYGEWQGTIKRREITGTGDVFMEHENNWDAGDQILAQAKLSSRNIWTVLPTPEETDDETAEQTEQRESLDYSTDWNNFNTKETNLDEIDSLFDRLGFELVDYHNSTSECSTANRSSLTSDVGADGTSDELKGVINFVRGQDYFDYNGNCNIAEIREHVLGDIYHSQLIEIGPPDGNTDFENNNEEAYYRSLKNYQSFKTKHANRKNIVYAGSNSGVLHAINAETGDEEWAFVPPFIAGKFPTIVNEDLDGATEGIAAGNPAGGSNAIFGVDGSPVVHDVWIKGLTEDGLLEDTESWHTILFVPYGRGGSGFSVLDVTNPIVENSVGPLHMFSVYNDFINNKVYIMDYKGEIKDGGYDYRQTQFNLSDSREALRADRMYNDAAEEDNEGTDAEIYTNRSAIDECKDDDDYTTGKFKDVGTTSCYEAKVFNFDTALGADGTVFGSDTFDVFKIEGATKTRVNYSSAKMVDGYLEMKFDEKFTYNTGKGSEDGSSEGQSSNIFISTSCDQNSGIEAKYDYSKLGETWSTPRIVRLPSPTSSDDITTDKYVAVMGAGMSSNYLCAGSAVYLVELGDMLEPGKIFGHAQNKGPILIADTVPTEVASEDSTTIRGSNITNAVPTNPIVITPDTAFNIPWRGALVYVNDREGKITKINLTNIKTDPDLDILEQTNMFDQTTLFDLNANTDNKRYSFFSMDAGIGVTTKDLWLFGGTGNFNALGERTSQMDNIMYGVRDVDYPMFKHLNGVHIPLPSEGSSFMSMALEGALKARSIDDAADCADVSGDTTGINCPDTEDAWKVRLDARGESKPLHTYRKVSAPPTLFKGQVYYPIYEPPIGEGINKCNIGNAYICVADDECGTNNTYKLIKGASAQANDASCLFVREGVLSELVVFGDKLFANVAGPSEDEDTLYSILAAPGEIIGNNSGWRESGF